MVPDGTTLARAREIADRIAANGPLAVRNIKASVLAADALPEGEAYQRELELGMEVMASNDAKEGPRAFLEKRAPNFTGKLARTPARGRRAPPRPTAAQPRRSSPTRDQRRPRVERSRDPGSRRRRRAATTAWSTRLGCGRPRLSPASTVAQQRRSARPHSSDRCVAGIDLGQGVGGGTVGGRHGVGVLGCDRGVAALDVVAGRDRRHDRHGRHAGRLDVGIAQPLGGEEHAVAAARELVGRTVALEERA